MEVSDMGDGGVFGGVPVDRLQKAAFGYFLDHANPLNGLVADTSAHGSPSSIAATGFGLAVYPVGVERGWITRAEGTARVLAALRFFSGVLHTRSVHATGYRGFYCHFLDMHSGARVWNSEVSTMDTALLVAGMLMAASYFDGDDADERELRSLAAALYRRVEWRWASRGGETLTMGWMPGRGRLAARWQGYSEAILLHVLALGSDTHPIAPSAYAAFASTYEWLDVGTLPTLYAGPLFIHLFSQAFIDFSDIRDVYVAAHATDYAENTRRTIAVQRRYAEENPQGFVGYSADLWGFTACLGPEGKRRKTLPGTARRANGGYVARGAPFGPDDGTVAPWAPLACLPFAPDAALSATRHIVHAYPGVLEGDRFFGAFNPSIAGDGPEGWVDRRFTGLDQGLLVLMIENHLTGLPWRLTRRSPVIATGLRRAGFSGGWLDEKASSGTSPSQMETVMWPAASDC